MDRVVQGHRGLVLSLGQGGWKKVYPEVVLPELSTEKDKQKVA